MTTLAFFNHKGGVSKTTTTFNVGWGLAKLGKKVLVVDADPQCNLTQTIIGIDKSAEFYNGVGKVSNIYKLVEPSLIKGLDIKNVPAIELIQHDTNKNLYLLAGSENIDEIEVELGWAIKTGSALPSYLNKPSILPYAIKEIARKNEIDVVIYDMSPSKSSLNQCLFMSSDYFIVPTSPDFYCLQAIESLSKFIPIWNETINPFRKSSIEIPFKAEPPKFLGIISQRYRPRKEWNKNIDTTKAFQEWIDRINNSVKNNLVPSLLKANLSISVEEFKTIFDNADPFNIVNIPDFNTLIARGQTYSIPIYELSKDDLLTFGNALNTQLVSIQKFKQIFDDLSKNLLKIL